jgi:hypothetical protein
MMTEVSGRPDIGPRCDRPYLVRFPAFPESTLRLSFFFTPFASNAFEFRFGDCGDRKQNPAARRRGAGLVRMRLVI